MEIIIGIVVIVLGAICWIGQSLAVFALPTAIKLGVFESEKDVDQSMYLFERFSQGIMDVILTWILPLSAALMIFDYSFWPVLALIGGGVYLYFPGVFIITRIVLGMRGIKIGKASSVMSAYVFGTLWTLSAIVMIYMAILKLNTNS